MRDSFGSPLAERRVPPAIRRFLSGTVFARGWRRARLDRWRIALGQIDAQALQARSRRLRARIVAHARRQRARAGDEHRIVDSGSMKLSSCSWPSASLPVMRMT
jgi:hypothetical protein